MAGPAPQAQTMIFTVDLGDGRVVDIEGPPNATPEQLQAFVAQSGQDLAPQTPGQPQQAPQGPAQLDKSGTEMVGQFGDDPNAVSSHMAPEDEAHIIGLLQAGRDAEATQYAASKGFSIANADAVKSARDQTGKVNPDAVYKLPSGEQLKALDTGGGAGAMTRGVLDSLTLGAAGKVGNLGRAIGDQIQGSDQSFMQDWNRESDIRKGVEQSDEEDHPWLRVSGQLLGGLALPSGTEGLGLRVGTDVLRSGGTMQEARAAIRVAVRNRLATVGGGYGAAHGALSADSPGEAVSGAVTEGALGAAAGFGLGSLGRTQRPPAGATDGQEVAAAAARQDIDPMAADVGGPMVRRMTSAVAQTPLGAGPIIRAGQRVGDQTQAARDRVAASVGQALRPEAAGQQARMGATTFIQRSGVEARGLYTAAERAAGDTRVAPDNAVAVLDRNIAELAETPGGAPGLARLQGLRDELVRGDVSVAGLRNMRTVLRDQFIADGLRGSDTERRVGQVLDAAAQDITDGLNSAGNTNAARLYAQADAAWRTRVQTIDNVIKPLIGTRDAPKSGEQVVKTLMADLQGNNARAVRFLRTLPAEEQANTRASIIGALGRQSKGAQNADGDGFSMAQFLTHWNEIGDTAKQAFFGDEARAALNDLARVAQGSKEAAAYANRSNTGGAIGGLATGATGLLGIATLGKTLALQYGAGRLLASPRFARWLARAPRTQLSPQAYTERLSRIARAEPAIANEVLQLQQRLSAAFTSSPTRLAADEAPDGVAGAQGNAGDQSGQQEGLQP
jgi:hypothetical protein